MLSIQVFRSLIFAEGNSNKFWKIELNSSSHTVVYGRVGTSVQTQTKDFADDAAARNSWTLALRQAGKLGDLGRLH